MLYLKLSYLISFQQTYYAHKSKIYFTEYLVNITRKTQYTGYLSHCLELQSADRLDRKIVALLRFDGVKHESRADSILLAAYKILRRIRRCAVEHLLVLRNG